MPDRDAAAALREALLRDQQGDWAAAHDLVADLDGPDAAWLHAYLHRKEGDLGNARYWYGRAGLSPRSDSLDAEWQDLADAFAKRPR